MNIQTWHGLTNKRLVRFPEPLEGSANLTNKISEAQVFECKACSVSYLGWMPSIEIVWNFILSFVASNSNKRLEDRWLCDMLLSISQLNSVGLCLSFVSWFNG